MYTPREGTQQNFGGDVQHKGKNMIQKTMDESETRDITGVEPAIQGLQISCLVVL